jgi:hypothetical protein
LSSLAIAFFAVGPPLSNSRVIAAAQPALPSLGKSTTLRNAATTLVSPTSSGNYYFFALPPEQDGNLSALPPITFSPGRWTLATTGSTDLPPSSFDFALPPPIRVFGSAPMSFRRDQDQTVKWDPTGLDPSAVVTLSLYGH